MTTVSIASWNINSVRSRIDRIVSFVQRQQPDILCIQEIKCIQEQFPVEAFVSAGLPHLAVTGQKGLHGVAIASRLAFDTVDAPDLCRHNHARSVAIRIDDTEIHNLYVPAGGYVANPRTNPKFAHKLDFVARMERYYKTRSGPPLVVVGDLNIAPEPADVWSHKKLINVVSHTPAETDGLKRVIHAGRFCDIARKVHPDDTRLYTWWSYRARNWQDSDRGRRLDHIWISRSALANADLPSFSIHKHERGGEKPSDHVPISLRLRL